MIKYVYIIAGPNGSGKTTFAKSFLPGFVHCPNFVNADLIAQGLAPFDPRTAAIKAGKLVLHQINEYAQKGVTFSFETTLAGTSYARLLRAFKKDGYSLHLFFLWIPTIDLAMQRIRERVKAGGHDVPFLDVKRRYLRGVVNFFRVYEPMLDSWMMFDNSGAKPVLIAKRRNGKPEVLEPELYDSVRKVMR
jgi:predicted ABC-type ATPase